MIQSFKKIKKISGTLSLPGDKSISHRALLFAALAEGESTIENLPESEDVQSTINCLKQLGVEILKKDNKTIVKGKGYKGLKKPDKPLNAGNSGTTARLLSGILITQDFESVITGDESLSNRPMKRIVEPLQLMGGNIEGSENETLPLIIHPAIKLIAIDYVLPVASAQVKSAIILAALHIDETTRITEQNQTRNHTEQMLSLGIEKNQVNKVISVSKRNYTVPQKYILPGDISSAAYFMVLSLYAEGSNFSLKNISLNPTRTAFLQILNQMGATISISEQGVFNGEQYGVISVRNCRLKNVQIPKDIIPNIIDEIPVLAIVGVLAEGTFEIRNARELRIKESDRIKSICYNLNLLGLDVKEFDDGFKFSGVINKRKPLFKSFGDHRIAMAFGILSCLLEDGGKVGGFEAVSVSNPGFVNQLKQIIS
jgi:3-phosphoshikimate 1-carboxyvinyltransferase